MKINRLVLVLMLSTGFLFSVTGYGQGKELVKVQMALGQATVNPIFVNYVAA